jgi:hypothetical protein
VEHRGIEERAPPAEGMAVTAMYALSRFAIAGAAEVVRAVWRLVRSAVAALRAAARHAYRKSVSYQDAGASNTRRRSRMATPVTSRSAAEFMRRHGMIETPRPARPRVAAGQLRLNDIPLSARQVDAHQMLDAAGDPPPDRGVTDQWPPAQEV